MATEDTEQNPFTRPRFIVAAVVVGLIVVLGIVIGIATATRNNSNAAPPSAPSSAASAAPTAVPSAAAGGASVCGLPGEVLSGSIPTAPKAQWEYQGTTAYPTSTTYGPAKTSDQGFRYCFQHSPTGALFAAANAIAQGADPAVRAKWADYVLAAGPNRAAIAASLNGAKSDSSGTRMRVAGFRVLTYDGETARIDVAVNGSTNQGAIVGSFVYALVWQDGDWKLNTAESEPFSFAVIPNLMGYVPWGE
ncbi:hypothetical protein ACFFGR_06490 [Arthrobacter liuii]|uniref:hypothetical protein n=1 Tax=Arthrobacter liuii TaxID=1476996 RepID=UPI0035E72C4C